MSEIGLDLKDKTILLVARRGSGKSELIKYLIQEYENLFETTIVISTTDFSGFYKSVVAEKNISLEYKDEIIEKLLNKLERVNKNKNQKSHDFKRVLLILDDVISDTRLAHSKSLEKVYTKGRHYGITLILASQYIKKISPAMRENTDYIFVGKITEGSRDIICTEFSDFYTSKEMDEIIRENAGRDYEFVIINCAASNKEKSMGLFKVDLN